MDLNSIQLPGSLVADLYTNSLIENIVPQSTGKSLTDIQNKPIELKSLGNNEKNILVMVRYNETSFLPDASLQLLTNMLTACKLSMADVAVINIAQKPDANYKEVMATFPAKIILLFDIEPSGFGLPMNFPFYQLQPFAGCTFLYAPSLEILGSDKVEKSKLWVILRRLFNI